MIQEYGVFHGTDQVGKVRLEKQGLYYCLSCRCAMKEGMYHLIVSDAEHREDLGTLLHLGDGFGLDTRFPVKRLGEGQLHFGLYAKRAGGIFVPIRPEEPFGYIDRLKNTFLEIQNGEKGIVIDDTK